MLIATGIPPRQIGIPPRPRQPAESRPVAANAAELQPTPNFAGAQSSRASNSKPHVLRQQGPDTHTDRSAPCRRLRAAIEAIAKPVFAAWAAFIGGCVAVSRRARATTTNSPDYCSNYSVLQANQAHNAKSRSARHACEQAKPSPVCSFPVFQEDQSAIAG
jgi:hypothetical protein